MFGRLRGLTLVLGCLCAIGCGDSDGKGEKMEEEFPDSCFQPGFTATGCTCEGGAVGSRTCTANLIYSECACQPPLEDTRCKEGEATRCPPCPGESLGLETVCLTGGTVDCPPCANAADSGI